MALTKTSKLRILRSGYDVTASIRSEAKAHQLLTINPSWKDKVHFGFVPELTAPNAFDKLFDKPYDFIVHTASPVAFKVNDVQKDLINPAVEGTLSLLQAAHRLAGETLKRFVLLGSAAAVLNSFEEEGVAGRDYTEKDWNPVTAADAIQHQDAVLGYSASKKLAELSAWNFMDENKPAFDLTVINPVIVIGPMLHPVPSPQSVNETNRFAIYNFLNGTYKTIEEVSFPFYYFVHVRDIAKAHVLAMTSPGASNKRILLVSGVITPQLVADTIREHFPELRCRVPEGNRSRVFPKGVNSTGWDASRSHEVFGSKWNYRSLEESVVDTVKDILRHEDSWNVTGTQQAKN